jgi:ATP-dependent DNA helicase DinG
MPSRLLSAFPAGVPIRRLPLDQAIARVAGGWPQQASARADARAP